MILSTSFIKKTIDCLDSDICSLVWCLVYDHGLTGQRMIRRWEYQTLLIIMSEKRKAGFVDLYGSNMYCQPPALVAGFKHSQNKI